MKYDNPIIISKETVPYLYLTEHSGIYLNEYDPQLNRYISIPINSSSASNYNVVSVQFWVRYPQETFSASSEFMTILSSSSSITINAIPEAGGKRAKLTIPSGCVAWQNGRKTNYPHIYPSEWHSFNISFPNLLNISNFSGEIQIKSGFVFNNISVNSFKEDKETILDENDQYIDNGAITYNQYTGNAAVSIEDIGSISIFSNGFDMFTDVVWEKFERPFV